MSSLIDIVHDQQQSKIPCEVWTRVVGYFRPESQCNKGKRGKSATAGRRTSPKQ